MKWFESNDIGIDLGTASVLVFMKGKGIVLREPSVVALDKQTGRMVAVGDEARHMIGRTPGNIVAIRPLRDGVISNYDVTEKMLCYFLQKVIGRRFFFKPRLVVCVPSGVTEVEKRSVKQASEGAGARHTSLIEEPIAAAIGAGIDIGAPIGNMVLDIGGGTTDVAVISLGSAVQSTCVKCAGDKMDEAIIRYMKKRHGLLIGERTAEEMKINIGTAWPRREEDEVYMDITGRNLVTGLPGTVRVAGNEMIEALEEPIQMITDVVHQTLEKTPPELAADISENGICMTGGGSLLFGLDKKLSESVRIPCYVAEDALSCVAIGTGKALEDYDKYSAGAITEYRRDDYLRR